MNFSLPLAAVTGLQMKTKVQVQKMIPLSSETENQFQLYTAYHDNIALSFVLFLDSSICM